MSLRWVANASPLITLARIGHIDLLTELSDVLVIPPTVAEEVMAGADDPACRWLSRQGQAYVSGAVAVTPAVASCRLDPGERAVLSWAEARGGWEALIDDLAARRCARRLGLLYRGTLGVVLAAKQAGLVPEAKPLLKALQRAGLRVSQEVLAHALRLASEEPE